MKNGLIMKRSSKTLTTLAISALLVATSATSSSADDSGYQEVVSEAGISAVQIAPAGSTEEQVDSAILDFQSQLITTRATGQYYSYCEEGSSGMMVWTDNDPKYCYGWYYEYLDGNRISKVNMLRLKADNKHLNAGSSTTEVNLVDWCNNNGFYCGIVMSAIPYVGKYLKKLLF